MGNVHTIKFVGNVYTLNYMGMFTPSVLCVNVCTPSVSFDDVHTLGYFSMFTPAVFVCNIHNLQFVGYVHAFRYVRYVQTFIFAYHVHTFGWAMFITLVLCIISYLQCLRLWFFPGERMCRLIHLNRTSWPSGSYSRFTSILRRSRHQVSAALNCVFPEIRQVISGIKGLREIRSELFSSTSCSVHV
jgi:hypothetical protein